MFKKKKVEIIVEPIVTKKPPLQPNIFEPVIAMPKPQRIGAPTKALLGELEKEKTLVERAGSGMVSDEDASIDYLSADEFPPDPISKPTKQDLLFAQGNYEHLWPLESMPKAAREMAARDREQRRKEIEQKNEQYKISVQTVNEPKQHETTKQRAVEQHEITEQRVANEPRQHETTKQRVNKPRQQMIPNVPKHETIKNEPRREIPSQSSETAKIVTTNKSKREIPRQVIINETRYEPKHETVNHEPRYGMTYYKSKHETSAPESRREAEHYEPRREVERYEPRSKPSASDPKRETEHYEPRDEMYHYEPKCEAEHYEPRREVEQYQLRRETEHHEQRRDVTQNEPAQHTVPRHPLSFQSSSGSSQTEQLLLELTKRILAMEEQQALDRADRIRQEQGLLENRNKMMAKLIEAQDQLTNVLKQNEKRSQDRSLSRHNEHSSSTTIVPVNNSSPGRRGRPRAKSIDQRYDDSEFYYVPRRPSAVVTIPYYHDDEAEYYVEARRANEYYPYPNQRPYTRSYYHYP
ncbi:unnamed protein product [Rhizopus stolonifer]